jgi:homoserine dehydrogenase
MKKTGINFGEALKAAQANGYAEANPTADIEGHDTCRKIAILSSIAFNEFVDYKNIYTEGITKISLNDLKYADEMDSVIKLIAISRKENDKIFLRVSPAILSKSNPLANVEDVFNAIVIKGNAIGEAMFYGRGAGKFPTASAVVADIIDIVRHIGSNNQTEWNVRDGDNVIDVKTISNRQFVRLKVSNLIEARAVVNNILGEVKWVRLHDETSDDEIAFVTSKKIEKDFSLLIEKVTKEACILELLSVIRLLEESSEGVNNEGC